MLNTLRNARPPRPGLWYRAATALGFKPSFTATRGPLDSFTAFSTAAARKPALALPAPALPKASLLTPPPGRLFPTHDQIVKVRERLAANNANVNATMRQYWPDPRSSATAAATRGLGHVGLIPQTLGISPMAMQAAAFAMRAKSR